jgi:cobalt-precorrin 5A hydrolase
MAPGYAGYAVDMDKAMIVAGVGCRRGAGAPDIEAAIRAALAYAGITAAELNAIATSTVKQSETGIRTAAAKLGLEVRPIADAELKSAGARVATRSDRVLALTGVASLAEAAALAAAGPSARLIARRIIVGAATCALASADVPQ